jgi:nitrite reductase/ring-hydroxylating ferredoxin subunit
MRPRPPRFAWQPHWYPIAHVREVSAKSPSRHVVLGEALVVWYDQAASGWRAAEDACPHRGAPLSAGRVSAEGVLACGYHGWTFPDAGPVGDPQSPRGGCAAMLRRRPARVCDRGLLWVWGDAASVPLDGPPRATRDEGSRVSDWMTVRFPAPFYAVVENAVDAAHAHHTHSGLAPGLSRENARPFERIASGERADGPDAWATWLRTSGAEGRHVYRYHAPQHVRLSFGQRAGVTIEAFVTPSTASETLFLSAAFAPKLPRALLVPPHVRAVSHRLGLAVAAQDVAMMPRGERDRAAAWRPRVYDASIARLDHFLRKNGHPLALGRRNDTSSAPPAPFDPWHAHGCRCPTCRGFVRDAQVAQVGWVAAALVLAGQPASVGCLGMAAAMRGMEGWMKGRW